MTCACGEDHIKAIERLVLHGEKSCRLRTHQEREEYDREHPVPDAGDVADNDRQTRVEQEAVALCQNCGKPRHAHPMVPRADVGARVYVYWVCPTSTFEPLAPFKSNLR